MNNSPDNRNLILAVILSALVFGGWYFFLGAPAMKAEQARAALAAKSEKHQTPAPATPGGLPAVEGGSAHLSRDVALKASGPRIRIDTPSVDGSLMLKGARFDDLRLKHYHDTADTKSPEIVLLAPKGTQYPYFVDFGWRNAPGGHQSPPN